MNGLDYSPMGLCFHHSAANKPMSVGLCRDFGWLNIDATAFLIEEDFSANQSKQGVIATNPNTLTGMPFRAVLSDENVTGDDGLATKFLHAKSFCLGITTVTARPLTLLMCHAEFP